MKGKIKGLLLCFVIAVPAWLLGRKFAVVGGPVISILLGMIVGMFLKNRAPFDAGIKFTSKKILQWAVILLGFGMNLTVIGQTDNPQHDNDLAACCVYPLQGAEDTLEDLHPHRCRLVDLRRLGHRSDRAGHRRKRRGGRAGNIGHFLL